MISGIPEISNEEYGFVERVVDPSGKRSFFYVAGIAERGTIGAALYLTREWRSLYKRYGADRNFLVMLRFDAAMNWSVVFEQ